METGQICSSCTRHTAELQVKHRHHVLLSLVQSASGKFASSFIDVHITRCALHAVPCVAKSRARMTLPTQFHQVFDFHVNPCFIKTTFRPWLSLMTINFVRTLGCLQPYPTGCLGTTRRCGKTGRHITKPVKGPRANMTYWWWSWTRLISVNLSYPDGGSGVRPSGHYMRPPIVSQLSSPYIFSLWLITLINYPMTMLQS